MKSTKNIYKPTIFACYRANIAHAAMNNLSPLLFIVYQQKFNLSYTLLASLILFNFCTQILSDILAVKYVDKIGYRKAATFSQITVGLGLVLMSILPNVMASPFLGLVIASFVCGMGGGVIEVILSPIIDSMPSDAKASAMSLLHSFYCWGQVLVVVVTTVLLSIIGDNLWYIIPLVWAAIPIYNFFSFLKVPLSDTIPHEEKTPLKKLFSSKVFLVAMIIMICAGASEISMAQWSSLFAETALGVPKVMGDLLGPCLFAVFMGIGRVIYGIYGHKINLFNTLIGSSALAALCYVGTALFQIPILALISCSLCGFGVALMWPGTISSSSAIFPKGGAAMFGVLAIGGDIGCSIGPGLLGTISDQAGLRTGMLAGTIFPIILLLGVIYLKHYAKTHKLDIQKRD